MSSLQGWVTGDLQTAHQLLEEELSKAAALSPADYQRKQVELLASTEKQVEGYAARLANGKMTPAQFRQAMTATLRTAHASAYRNGASSVNGRSPLSDADLAVVSDQFGDQLDYLDNFARQAKAANGTDAAFSEAYLANRAGMYADSLRSTFWSGALSRHDDTYQVWFDAIGDDHTCDACENAEAASPYPVDEAPLPGGVCDGGPNCRCELRFELKPDAA